MLRSATAWAVPCPTRSWGRRSRDRGRTARRAAGLVGGQDRAVGPDWIRTTESPASTPRDSYAARQGRRRDQPGRIQGAAGNGRRVLVSHPGVRDACVVGVPDTRLGQVPFAAIEAVAGYLRHPRTNSKSSCAKHSPSTTCQSLSTVVDELPRNPALKVSLPAVAALTPAVPRKLGRYREPRSADSQCSGLRNTATLSPCSRRANSR